MQMNKNLLSTIKKQQGAATLLTAVIILIAITLVSFLSGKTVLNETKITADNYRTTQAVSAANYAMDYGVNYFDNGGFTQDGNVDPVTGEVIADVLVVPSLESTDDTQTTSATVLFDNTLIAAGGCNNKEKSWQNGRITATGFSDDGLATRTITQCVGPIGLIQNGGPKQPLVAQGQVFMTGNASIVNRYTDTTVWSGDEVKIGSSSSMKTYIRVDTLSPLSASGNNFLDRTDDTDLARLLNVETTSDTQLVSNRNLGNGLDIIDDDPNLGNLSGLAFFENFFKVDRIGFKSQADDLSQVFNSISDAVGKSGAIWIEGDAHLTGGTIGSIAKPAILVINGDLTSTGNSTIYGLLYTTGTYSVGGTVNVIGSNVVEGTVAPITIGTEVASPPAAAPPPVVSGHGTLNLIFWPAFADGDNGSPMVGQTAVISGSWRDW